MDGGGAEAGDLNPAPQQGPGVQVQGGVVEGKPGTGVIADLQAAETRGQGQLPLQALEPDPAAAQGIHLIDEEALPGVGVGGQQQGGQQQQRHADEDERQASQEAREAEEGREERGPGHGHQAWPMPM